MAAHSLSVPVEHSSGSFPFSRYPAVSSISGPSASRHASGKPPARQCSERSSKQTSSAISDLDLILSSLVESLQQGVLVVSRNLRPVYWNVRAKRLCRTLVGTEFSLSELPVTVSEVCHRLIKGNRPTNQPLVMECQVSDAQTIRITVRWLNLLSSHKTAGSVTSDSTPYILVFLENCSEALREELRIERKKYDLTEREAEVWMLLRQEYTYQEIAKMLQISLNTVKTHVKNAYAKKRSCQGKEKFWCSE